MTAMNYASTVAGLNHHAMGDSTEWDEHGRKIFDLAEKADAEVARLREALAKLQKLSEQITEDERAYHNVDDLQVFQNRVSDIVEIALARAV